MVFELYHIGLSPDLGLSVGAKPGLFGEHQLDTGALGERSCRPRSEDKRIHGSLPVPTMGKPPLDGNSLRRIDHRLEAIARYSRFGVAVRSLSADSVCH